MDIENGLSCSIVTLYRVNQAECGATGYSKFDHLFE